MSKKFKIIIIYISVFIIISLLIKLLLHFGVEYFNIKDITGPRINILIMLLPAITAYFILQKITKIKTSGGYKYELKWKFLKNLF